MLRITVDGLDQLRKDWHEFSDRRFASAVATALTRTAASARLEMQSLVKSSLDKPTPYTVNQLRYVAASPDRLRAGVGFNIGAVTDIAGKLIEYRDMPPGDTPAGKYLQFQTEGGQRAAKRFERALQKVGVMPAGMVAVPGSRAKMDAYGNQSPAEIRQILSWFSAAELVAGSRQNMTDATRDKRRKGTRKTAGWEYVVVQVKRGGLRPGIYRRTWHAMGQQIEPIVMFVSQAKYRARFPFYAQAQEFTARTLPGELERAIRESAERLAARWSA